MAHVIVGDGARPQPNIHCPFCGIVLEFNDPENPIPSTHQRRWLAEIRAVFVVNQTEPPFCPSLTGVGYLSSRNILSAPLDSNLSYKETEAPLEELTLSTNRGVSYYGYGFHDSCWELFFARLQHITTELHDILKSIFTLLFTTPCPNFSVFQFNHDYGGAAETHKPFGRPNRIDPASVFYADPCTIPSPATLEDFALDSTLLPARNRRVKDNTTGLGRFFGRLPLEIVYEILSYLPLVEVTDIRLVCRELATIAECENLPPSFWRSRFMLGHEEDYIFADLKVMHDWFRLFHGSRYCLLNGNKSLLNRKRIRTLLEPIALLVEYDVTDKTRSLLGLPISPVASDEGNWHLDSDNKDCFEVFNSIRSFTGQLASRDDAEQLTQGCRVLQYRIARFPFQPPGAHCGKNHIRQFRISTIQIGSRCYITGIRYSSLEVSSLGGFPLAIGFCTAATGEKAINVPQGAVVKLVEVAFCDSGLVGIRFVFSGKGNGYSHWVGQSGGQGVARGFLQPPGNKYDCHFIAGLNAYKIVVLGLAQPDGVAPGLTSSLKGKDPELNCPQSQLWIPSVPTHESLAISTMEPFKYRRVFDPLVNVDFGGPQGILLPFLTRIVVHMLAETCPIVGMDFFYTDRCMRFGSGGATELSFFLDGPAGERITAVEVTAEEPEFGVRGLQISTNHGRSMLFTGLRHFYNTAWTKLRPQQPQVGYIISGFVASLSDTQGRYFARIGLQSQPPVQGDVACESFYNEGVQHVPENEMKYDLEFSMGIRTTGLGEYSTYAPLTGVRRIAASTGSSQQSRLPCHISGMRFDYYDKHSPIVVGQWMDEHDAIMDLGQGEELKSFTIWLTKEGEYACIRGLKQGRVVAIQVNTSHGQSKMFEPDGMQAKLHDCIKYQYQPGPRESFKAMSWILNSSFDRVRVITSLKMPGTLELMPWYAAPFDQVQRFFFEEELEGGTKDRMDRIVAYFGGGSVCGLSFVYRSQQSRSAGNTSTDEFQTAEIGQGEVVSFSVAKKDSKIVEFELQIGPDQNSPTVSRSYKLNACHGASDSSGSRYYSYRNTWYMSEISAGRSEVVGWDTEYFPPRGARFVGIYVGCEDISRVGALVSGGDS